MKKEINKFEERFEPQEEQLTVLTGGFASGAGKAGKELLWTASQTIIAYIDEAGTLTEAEGRLEWLAEDSQRDGWIHDLNGKSIYRVKVKRRKPAGEKTVPWQDHCFQLLEVLERDADQAELAQILTAYETPVIITDPRFGEFELNKELHYYDGSIDWLGEEVSVSMDLDDETKGDSMDRALKALYTLMDETAQWDEKLKRFAAEKLTDLANDWLADSDEEDPEPITEAGFAGRIEMSELAVHEDGSFDAYYDDDDMFWGHIILIYGNVDGELSDAHIAG